MKESAEAFVATRYLLGVRGEALGLDLDVAPHAAAKPLAAALAHPDQRERAKSLARPLRRILQALEAMEVSD